MAASARLALTVALGLSTTTCTLPQADAPSTSPAPVRPQQVQVLLDGQALHPRVATVTLLPGQSVFLLATSRVRRDGEPGKRTVLPSESPLPRVTLSWAARDGAVWHADTGTLAIDARPGRARYTAPARPGLDRLRLVSADGTTAAEVMVLILLPFDAHGGTIGSYRIGHYPAPPPADSRRGQARYTAPPGFVEVTPATRDATLSRHVRLRDLECKQDHDGFPRYLALDVRLLDKLERLADALDTRGLPGDALTIMSGYRTPYYNHRIGNRTPWSRHVMGDAADVFVDADGDGTMDDLDGNGRISLADAEALLAVVDVLDRDAALAGGAAAYPGTASHGPFVHLDTRGYRARW